MATSRNSHNIAKPGTRGPDANPATSMGYARLLHSQDSYRHKYNATQGQIGSSRVSTDTGGQATVGIGAALWSQGSQNPGMKQDERRRKIIGGIVAARGPNVKKAGNKTLMEGAGKWKATEERRGTAGPGLWAGGVGRQPDGSLLGAVAALPSTRQGPGTSAQAHMTIEVTSRDRRQWNNTAMLADGRRSLGGQAGTLLGKELRGFQHHRKAGALKAEQKIIPATTQNKHLGAADRAAMAGSTLVQVAPGQMPLTPAGHKARRRVTARHGPVGTNHSIDFTASATARPGLVQGRQPFSDSKRADTIQTALATLDPAGRSQKFTRALMNRLFVDSTIQTSTLKKHRQSLRRDNLKEKEIKAQQDGEAFRKKRRMAQELYNDHNIAVSANKLTRCTEFDLLKLRKRLEVDLKHQEAAKRLQRWWRRHRERRFQLTASLMVADKVRFVMIVQRWWQARARVRRAVHWRKECVRAARTIQRAARVLLDKTRAARVLQMDGHFRYFEEMRQRLLESSQIVIQYRWRRYIRLKKRAESERVEKELAAQVQAATRRRYRRATEQIKQAPKPDEPRSAGVDPNDNARNLSKTTSSGAAAFAGPEAGGADMKHVVSSQFSQHALDEKQEPGEESQTPSAQADSEARASPRRRHTEKFERNGHQGKSAAKATSALDASPVVVPDYLESGVNNVVDGGSSRTQLAQAESRPAGAKSSQRRPSHFAVDESPAEILNEQQKQPQRADQKQEKQQVFDAGSRHGEVRGTNAVGEETGTTDRAGRRDLDSARGDQGFSQADQARAATEENHVDQTPLPSAGSPLQGIRDEESSPETKDPTMQSNLIREYAENTLYVRSPNLRTSEANAPGLTAQEASTEQAKADQSHPTASEPKGLKANTAVPLPQEEAKTTNDRMGREDGLIENLSEGMGRNQIEESQLQEDDARESGVARQASRDAQGWPGQRMSEDYNSIEDQKAENECAKLVPERAETPAQVERRRTMAGSDMAGSAASKGVFSSINRSADANQDA